jgi:beta-glucosidase
MIVCASCSKPQLEEKFKPYCPPVSFESADKRAEEIITQLSIEEKIELIGGHNLFFVKGLKKHNIPPLYLSDATQGVHIRKTLPDQLEKSTAFPCPISLAATWNTDLAKRYATSIGEECRAGGIAVLLGPGVNLYRISQNGRNFEYFGEDPFLAARIIENYIVGVQSTGTMATLKHFVCNNTDFRRRTSNSVVDERTLHEIYLPIFKAGIDAGAMAVMTSYNQVNGEWAGQSDYVINKVLRQDLGFKWLVMSDWWSIWDPEKAIKSGLDLDMPGHPNDNTRVKKLGNPYIRSNAKRLLEEAEVSESHIKRMAKSVLRVSLAMGLDKRAVKDASYLTKFPQHLEVALQAAREGIVLLRNQNNILPVQRVKTASILLTGEFTEKIARGSGSAEVEGYDNITMAEALKSEFGDKLNYIKNPSDQQLSDAEVVLLSIGTLDTEGWDRPFQLPESTEQLVKKVSSLNKNVVVIVNSGSGIRMTDWYSKVSGIIYGWYPGQIGYKALAEIISGKTNPSGKLPISIEKNFKDSPGFPYIPEGESFYKGWDTDMDMSLPIYDIVYDEGIFVGYRWYESKKIEPLYPFGFGLSYTHFDYNGLKLSASKIGSGEKLFVEFKVKNTGKVAGAEIAQIYVQDLEASVPRPIKELKGFKKVFLNAGEGKKVKIILDSNAFAYWDVEIHDWKVEAGKFNISVGSSSSNIRLTKEIEIK